MIMMPYGRCRSSLQLTGAQTSGTPQGAHAQSRVSSQLTSNGIGPQAGNGTGAVADRHMVSCLPVLVLGAEALDTPDSHTIQPAALRSRRTKTTRAQTTGGWPACKAGPGRSRIWITPRLWGHETWPAARQIAAGSGPA
jgi:hypothetical protein